MDNSITSIWHFPVMVLTSFILFLIVISVVLGKQEFIQKKYSIFLLSLVVVIVGMLFGKYGINWGLNWWIYYPIPLLMNIVLPPLVLKMNSKKAFLYLFLSFLSAPLIHVFFSMAIGWTEYMPFWNIKL